MNYWKFEQPCEHRGNKSRKHIDLVDNDLTSVKPQKVGKLQVKSINYL